MSQRDISDITTQVNFSEARVRLRNTALEALCRRAQKILLHLEGVYGVARRYAEAGELLERAAHEHYLLLDLGHVLRLYFGDDYFDVVLENHVIHQRPDDIEHMVRALVRENHANQ